MVFVPLGQDLYISGKAFISPDITDIIIIIVLKEFQIVSINAFYSILGFVQKAHTYSSGENTGVGSACSL